jgi:hypothetical protein
MVAYELHNELLGIPLEECPPNHYTLLGLELFESEADKIHATFLRRIATLRKYALDPDPKRARKIQEMLNEISRAGAVLESPQIKQVYDHALRKDLGMVAGRQPCSNCGASLATDAVICTFCGLELATGEFLGAALHVDDVGAAPVALPQSIAAPAATAAQPAKKREPILSEDSTSKPRRRKPARLVIDLVIFAAVLVALVLAWQNPMDKFRLVVGWLSEHLSESPTPSPAVPANEPDPTPRPSRPKPGERPRKRRARGPTQYSDLKLAPAFVETQDDKELIGKLAKLPPDQADALLGELVLLARGVKGRHGLVTLNGAYSSVMVRTRQRIPRMNRAQEILCMAYGLKPGEARQQRLMDGKVHIRDENALATLAEEVGNLRAGKLKPLEPFGGSADTAYAIARRIETITATRFSEQGDAPNACTALIHLGVAVRAARALAIASAGWKIDLNKTLGFLQKSPDKALPVLARDYYGRSWSEPARRPIAGRRLTTLERLAFKTQLKSGHIAERRAAVQALFNDESAQGIKYLIAAAKNKTSDLACIEIMRALARSDSPEALAFLLMKVKSRDRTASTNAAILLCGMTGHDLTHYEAGVSIFGLPLSHSTQRGKDVHREFENVLRRYAAAQRSSRIAGDADIFRYLSPDELKLLGSPDARIRSRRRKEGLRDRLRKEGEAMGSDDIARLLSVLSSDLKLLAATHKESKISRDREVASFSPSWAKLVARGRFYSERPRARSIPYSIKLNYSDNSVRMDAASRKLDAIPVALDSLIAQLVSVSTGVDSKPYADIKDTANARSLVAQDALQTIVVRLDGVIELLHQRAKDTRPSLASSVNAARARLRTQDAKTQDVLEQMSLRARYLVTAHLMLAGLEVEG